MNKLNLIAIGVGVVLFAGMAAAGGKMMDDERAGAVTKFAITVEEMPMMTACEETLRYQDIEFKSGVSEISGCGCITREIHDRIQPKEFAFAAELLPKVIVASVETKRQDEIMDEISHIIAKHDMSSRRTESVFTSMLDSVGICSAHSEYRTPEENAKIEADEKAAAKEKADKSRIAFNEAVRRGVITRAEADRRMASMDRRN